MPMFAVVSPTPSIDMSTEHRSSVDRVSVETTAISAGVSTDTRCPCQGTEMGIVQIPWCPRSNRVLVRLFIVRHFV